nr:dna-directed rna polymerase iii subunit rpc3 [Quercus suber]
MSKPLADLCGILIKDQFGELCARIFSTLAEHGRLHLHALILHSKIPTRRLKHGLGILLEQQLVRRHIAEDDVPIMYQADWRNAYDIVRHDAIMELVKERYGEGAGQVVGSILQSGIARIGDVADSYDFAAAPKQDHTVEEADGKKIVANGLAKSNGQTLAHSNPAIGSLGELHKIFRLLLDAQILVKVGTRSYESSRDRDDQAREQIINERFPDGKITGAKKAKEFSRAVNTLKRQMRDEDEYSESRDLGSKHSVVSAGNSNKRVKLNGSTLNGQSHNSDEVVRMVTHDLVVRVNYGRCILALRSRRLRKMAKRYFGPVTATVYGALLETLENKCKSPRDDLWLAPDDNDDDDDESRNPPQPVSNVAEVADLLDPSIDLASAIKGLGPGKLVNGAEKDSKKTVRVDDDEDDELEEIGTKAEHTDGDGKSGYTSYRDRAKRIQHVQAHLTILEEHGNRFCEHVGQSEWRVDFPAITEILVHSEIDATVSARYEQSHLRVIRMLRERGKLEEKQIAGSALTVIKDIRGLLTQLQFDGYLDAQELPKDNTRHPTRTLYLWFCDENRVRSMLLQQSYKTMVRTLQRVQVERVRFRDIIDRMNRTDVKGREEKLMPAERARLRNWRDVEERLLTQVSRLDEVVTVLRDFDGKDTSLLS